MSEAPDLRARHSAGDDVAAILNDPARRHPVGSGEPSPADPSPANNITPGPQPSGTTDSANAERFAREHQKSARFCPALGWLVWDDKRWLRDDLKQVRELAKATAREMLAVASKIKDDTERADLVKWARASESRRRIDDMLELAKSCQGIAVRHEEFDADPYLLNCLNGTVDLRGGTVRPHDQGDAITKLAPVGYDPQAICPRWIEFLNRTFSGDEELIGWMQRWLGYCLTGAVGEQCLAFFFGSGANGKSVLTELMFRIMGDYALRCPSSIVVGKPGGIPNDVAQLPGVRFAVASELPEGQAFNEPVLKDLTGSDTLTARFMRREFFQFRPSHKLVIFGNHKPYVKGSDEGIWRRLRLVPFSNTIPEGERDPELVDKLIGKEAAGILAWLVEGCVRWQSEGLGTPAAVKKATVSYREEMDIVGQFIEDHYVADQGAALPKDEIFKHFQHWCEDGGYGPRSSRWLTGKLILKGWEDQRRNTGRFWLDFAKTVKNQG